MQHRYGTVLFSFLLILSLKFFLAFCAINVAVGAPQLNIPGVRTVSTIRETTEDQERPSFSSFPSRFSQDRNVEAEISSITVENSPAVSSVFRTGSGTTAGNAGNGRNILELVVHMIRYLML